MNFSTVAHDPSGPPGHLPSFAGEESMSATQRGGYAARSGALPAKIMSGPEARGPEDHEQGERAGGACKAAARGQCMSPITEGCSQRSRHLVEQKHMRLCPMRPVSAT